MRPKPPSEPFLLDKFTDKDVDAWDETAEAEREYVIKEYFYLEGERALVHAKICEALRDTETISIPETQWTRIVDYKYSLNPLSAKGSIIDGKRFNIGADLDNFPSFPALYVGEDEPTAQMERFGNPSIANGLSAEDLALRKKGSYLSVNFKVKLKTVFDLTKAANLKKFTAIIAKFRMTPELRELAKAAGRKPQLIKTTSLLKQSLLDPDWKRYPTLFDIPANSQLFGRYLNDAKFSGILYPSVRAAGKKNLGIFVENFEDDDFVALADAHPPEVKYPRLTADNWKEVLG